MTAANHNGRSYTYKYNADGLRTQKSVDGTTTYYIYSGDKLAAQKTGNNTIYLEYDSTGSPFLISYNGSHYYYILNGQGDVIALIDNTGNTVVEYTYDPWGQITSITGALAGTLGQANPIRYRGYYYDSETGFYYVSSRYYDPEIGRWISADGVMSDVGGDIRGYNLFAYCMNNPVNMSDPSGNWPKWATKLVAAVAVVAVVAVVAAVTVATAGAGTAIAAVAVGAAKGAAIGFAVGAASGAAIGYATTGTLEGTLNGMADGALSGAVSGAVAGGVSGGVGYVAKAHGFKIEQVGRLKPSNKPGKGNLGVKYQINKANGKPTIKSFEFHANHAHKGYQPHWQRNMWNPYNNSISAKADYWTWWGRRI